MNIKEKLINALGWLGYIIFYAFALFVSVFPVSVVSSHYNWPSLVYFLVAIIAFNFNFVSFVFWVYGLILMINGPQDTLAIVYYIAFAVVNLSGYFFSIALRIIFMFKKLFNK